MLPLWLAGIGTLALAFVTAWVTWIKPWLDKPKFSVEFDNCEPYCRPALVSSKEPYTIDGHPPQLVNAYWLRLKVKNSGNLVAKRCIGKLVKVMDGSGKELPSYDPMQLHWVGTSGEDVPLRPIDLNRGEHEFLDIIYTRADCPDKAFICTDTVVRGISKYFSPGQYRIQITIYGDNVDPESRGYDLIWGASHFKDIGLKRK